MSVNRVEIGRYYKDTRDGEIIKVINSTTYKVIRKGNGALGSRAFSIGVVHLLVLSALIECPKLKGLIYE